jgi:hypothetical protein
MEVLWFTPLVHWMFTDLYGPLLPLAPALVYTAFNVMLAVGLRRLLIHHRWTSKEQLPLFIGGILLSILLSVLFIPLLVGAQNSLNLDFLATFNPVESEAPFGLYVLPTVLWLWWRGSVIGREFLTHMGVSMQLRFGILMFFFYAVLPPNLNHQELLVMVTAFFVFGLLSVALVRSATLKLQDTMVQRGFGNMWLGLVISIVALFTIAGLVFGVVLDGLDRQMVFEGLVIIGGVIVAIGVIILSPFLWLFEQLLPYFPDPSELFRREEETGQPDQPVQAADDVDRLEYGEILSALLEFLGTAIVVMFIAFLLYYVIRFWLSLLLAREDVTFDNLEKKDEGKRELIDGLRRGLANQLRRIGETLGMLRHYGISSDLLGAITIRWLYARMENIAQRRGYPRVESETPYEYQQALSNAYPGGEDDIKIITEAYVRIRYGETPENRQEVNIVRNALNRLKAIEVSSS